MALTAHGFPGSVNDLQWSRLMSLIGNDGTDGMSVSAASGDRTVSVGAGVSNVGGVLAWNDSSLNVGPLPSNTSSNPRIDRILLRANWSNRTLTATYRQGTPSSSPQPPSISHVRNPGVQYEVALAQVRVPPGQGPLNSGLITQERTPPASGFYRIASIATAPDPEDNALIWYAAANSLRVPINGSYVEIANGRPKRSEVRAATSTTQAGLSGTYLPGNPQCSVNFVASETGAVQIDFGGYVVTTAAGARTTLSVQVRQGSTQILGPHAHYSVSAGEVVQQNQESVNGGSNWVDVVGLTPGVTYNARTMAHCTVTAGGRIEARRIRVRHIP